MTSYLIRFTKPDGTIDYWPKGFGYTSHAHTLHASDAEHFDTHEKAQRSLNGYIHPPAFWESERRHAENMRQQTRGWKCEIIPANP